ncbi:jg994 [Pararge aegeria aegeria]|uniref:Jg994 protein n=1 Tax=Pararge aegeria aegeria TaxID=348720 RepID=A0A8S4QVL8_9NEOP|nr:jg994 [Pararge aegeria aegeria]
MAHAGTEGNERAEQLEKEAALKKKTDPTTTPVLYHLSRKTSEKNLLRTGNTDLVTVKWQQAQTLSSHSRCRESIQNSSNY